MSKADCDTKCVKMLFLFYSPHKRKGERNYEILPFVQQEREREREREREWEREKESEKE